MFNAVFLLILIACKGFNNNFFNKFEKTEGIQNYDWNIKN
jgi:hypothetical protein